MKKNLNKVIENIKNSNKNLGITLIALIVTIVILLIISTVAVTLLINNNLIGNAKTAVDKYNNSVDKENYELAKLMNETDNLSSSRADTQASGNPTGTIISFAADNPPEGYLACNGQEVSRTTYSQLFEAIGTKYGEGNGNTTFNVPNLTGRFLKGDTTAGINQQAGLPNITGTINGVAIAHTKTSSGTGALYNAGTGSSTQGSGGCGNDLIIGFNAQRINSIYGNSTTVTPENTSVLYCIKY